MEEADKTGRGPAYVQKQNSSEKVHYRFTRVKDVHTEDGRQFITLFGRLAKEGREGSESVWVELEEVPWASASPKLKSMPNAARIYCITENVFLELQRISARCHEELYFITPIHHHSEMRRLGYPARREIR